MQVIRFPAVPTPDEVKRRWAHDGFDCSLWVDPPGQRWPCLTHRGDEMLLVTEGRLLLEMQGGEPLTLQPGDEVLIPAGVEHQVRNVGKSEARWLFGYRYRL